MKSSEIASKSKIRESQSQNKKHIEYKPANIVAEFRRENRRNERTTQRELKGREKKKKTIEQIEHTENNRVFNVEVIKCRF